MQFRWLVVVVALASFAATAAAQIPQTMHYQGTLSDSAGTPLVGMHALSIQLYNQSVGGAPLWAETLQVDLVGGLFSVTLGQVHPLTLPFDEAYWLSLAVDGGVEFDPRSPLAAAPYSLNAHSTVAEPQPGQGLTVRDSAGSPVHVLSAQGGSTHLGKSVFDGQNDTGVVIRSQVGPGLAVFLQGTTGPSHTYWDGRGWQNPFAAAFRDTTDPPGMIVGSGNGGIIGTSPSSFGVRGISNADVGVSGESNTGPGGDFYSSEGTGVKGRSFLGTGGEFQGNPAVKASGTVAGLFDGQVLVGELHVVQVDSTDSVTDTLTSFYPDGTSKHYGPETFLDGIEVTGGPAGQFVGDVNVQGEVYAQSLHVVTFNPDGTVAEKLINFNSDGTSEHFGHEAYYAGAEFVPDSNSSRSVTISPDTGTISLRIEVPSIDPALYVGGTSAFHGDDNRMYGDFFAAERSPGAWSLELDTSLAQFRTRVEVLDTAASAAFLVDPNPTGEDPVLTVNGGGLVKGTIRVEIPGEPYPLLLVDPFAGDMDPMFELYGNASMAPDDTSQAGLRLRPRSSFEYTLDMLGYSGYANIYREGQDPVTEIGPGYVKLADTVAQRQAYLDNQEFYFTHPTDSTLRSAEWTAYGFAFDHDADGNFDLSYDSSNGGAFRVDLGSDGTADFEVHHSTIDRVTCRSTFEVQGASCNFSDNVFVGGLTSTLQLDVSATATVLGALAVGPTTPSNIITVHQGSSTDPVADAWTTWSSRRWKENIGPIQEPLEKVQRLRGVEYDWKETGQHDIGLIAEEVGEVIPEIVAYEDNGIDARSVDYARLVALLIEAVKAQQERIETLERQQVDVLSLLESWGIAERAEQAQASPGERP